MLHPHPSDGRSGPGRAEEPLATDVLAAIDIGTNSIRLEVVRIEDNRRILTLSQQKETVRLGDGEFVTNRMTPAAIDRGVLVCTRFADVARGFGAGEIMAMATSAVREAENRDEFIARVFDATGLEVKVISGMEEARLIYHGVVSGANPGDRRALFFDIGGGSTEFILGDARDHFLLESLKLGSMRVTNRFLEGEKGAVSPERFHRIQEYCRASVSHVVRDFADYGFDEIYGGAGTVTNLATATARRLGEAPASLRNYVVRVQDLRETVEMICRLPLEDRRRVPGLDADRADIVIGGAAVLMAVLDAAGAETLKISDRGVRHGIIEDRLNREDFAAAATDWPVRMRSVLHLAEACRYEEPHARHVVKLALRLFDEARRVGLHPYGRAERELLQYAGILHDIGGFVSHSNHHQHAYYLIRNSDLLGFNAAEIQVIANVALYHRKGTPKKAHDNLTGLSRQARKLVSVLSAFLRIAEGLDRSHLCLVRDVSLERERRASKVALRLASDAECDLEVWWVEDNRELFEQTFRVALAVEVER